MQNTTHAYLVAGLLVLSACGESSPGFSFTLEDTFETTSDRPDVRPGTRPSSTVTAIVPDGDGVKRIAMTFDAHGRAELAEPLPVPAGPVRVEIATPLTTYTEALVYRVYYDFDGTSPVLYGDHYLRRYSDATVSETPPVQIQATLTEPIGIYDSLELVSTRTDMWLSTFLDEEPADVTAIDWLRPAGTLRNRNSTLFTPPSAAFGDDLMVVHRRVRVDHPQTQVLGDPWARTEQVETIASFSVPDASLSADTLNVLSGTMVEAPSQTLDLDFPVAEYYGMLDTSHPSPSRYVASVEVYYEPMRDGSLLSGVAPPLYSLSALTLFSTYASEACVDMATSTGFCDPELCPIGCGAEGSFTDPGNLRTTIDIRNPYSYAGAPVITSTLSYSVAQRYPPTNANRFVSMSILSSRLLADADGEPLLPRISMVTNIRIDGMPIAFGSVLNGVSARPVVTFDPPSTGNAARYIVRVYDYEPRMNDAGALVNRVHVAYLSTREATIPLEPEIFVPGRYYMITIEARSDPALLEDYASHRLPEMGASLTASGFFSN